MPKKKFTNWNHNKASGWNKYRDLTMEYITLDRIASNSSDNANDIFKKINKELTSINYQAFGKVKVKRRKDNETLEALLKEKQNLHKKVDDDVVSDAQEIDARISAELQNIQRKDVEEKLNQMAKTKENKCVAAVVYELKVSILGKKKLSDEPSAVFDPKTKKLVFKPEEIREVAGDYCEALLTNREPREGFEQDIELKNLVHIVRMKERDPDDEHEEFSVDLFNKVYRELQRKPGKKYDFIVKGGPSLKAVVMKLCETVWVSENKPDAWRDSLLIQLNKNKPDKMNLDNKRHIHTKDPFQKFFSHMVTSLVKPIITENISPFQIGAMSGHRAEEHLFTLKSILALAEENHGEEILDNMFRGVMEIIIVPELSLIKKKM